MAGRNSVAFVFSFAHNVDGEMKGVRGSEASVVDDAFAVALLGGQGETRR